jgi:S-adenosylmethionine/arginine decarboxylase-like enzyme
MYPNIREIKGSYYGKHTLIDCKKCKREKVNSIENWRNFFDKLIPSIGMQAHGDLIIDRFGEGEDVGISACQLILTSAITVHTNDRAGDFYLDIFSCKDYDDKLVLDMVDKFFEPLEKNRTIILR